MILSKTLFNTLNTKLNLNTISLKEEKLYLENLSKKLNLFKNFVDIDYKLSWKKDTVQLSKNSKSSSDQDFVVMYIVTISFLKANTVIHISDIKGNVKLFYSSGSVNLSGKQKTKRRLVLLRLISLISKKTDFLNSKPIALHLNNVSSYKPFIVNKLKNNFYIKIIKSFNQTPYNGCRKKKIRRKKYTKKFK